jgi:hypothetical protein
MNNGHNQLIVNARGDSRPAGQSAELDRLRLAVNVLQLQMTRQELARAIGQTHDGRRDTWKVFGYPDTISIKDYWSWYERGGMAGRIIDIYPQYTWKGGFVLVDGDERSDDKGAKSAFLQAWVKLAAAQQIWRHFRAVDTLARIGRFAVMLIGAVDGSQNLEEPMGSVRDLAYLNVFGEPDVSILEETAEADPQSPRFGLPKFYQIDLGKPLGKVKVHYSRVIHVAEGRLKSDLYGYPALERVYNSLIDKLKVTGGSAEAFWLLINPGTAIISEDGFGDDDTSLQAFQDEVDKYKHGFDRFLQLSGRTKVQQLDGNIADPRSPYGVAVDEISATTGIPRRVLLGTEEGQLAGSQDERSLHNNASARRTDHAEPVIARPFIDWCIATGVLPPPTAGEYEIEWASLFEATQQQQAETANTAAQAIDTYCGDSVDRRELMPPEEFATRYFGYTPAPVKAEDGEPETTPPTSGGAPASEAAPENLESVKGLNGAQITAALEVVAGLSDGTISPVVATELLVALGLDRGKVDLIIKATPAGGGAHPAPVYFWGGLGGGGQRVDEEALEHLKEQIRAEWAKAAELKRQNDLAEQTLQALNRSRISEQTRVQFWAGISEQTAAIVARLPETALLLHSLAEKIEEFSEALERTRREDGQRLARLEYGLMLLLQGKGNGNRAKTKALVEDIDRDRTRRKLLERHYRALNELQVQLASYGISKPVEMVLQVEDLEKEIDRLEQEMEDEL